MSLKSSPIVRIVSRDKAIKSRFLNVLGVQVLRTVAGRSIYNLRPTFVDETIKSYVEEVKSEGVVVVTDFLPTDHFDAVRKEYLQIFESHSRELKVLKHGPNTLEVAALRNFGESLLSNATKYFFHNTRLIAILEALEKHRLNFSSYSAFHRAFERLTQGSSGEKDPETELHSDIFYNTHKAWLYLDDVQMEDGPLVYVKRSNRLSLTQLYYVYKESCMENNGSRRIIPSELERLGLKETVFTCPKNTLVIANTFGYHRRLRGQPGRRRPAIHVSLRTNPFRLLWGSS